MIRPINTIIIHCAYTKPDMDIGVKEIKQWHIWPKPYDDGTFYYQGKIYANDSELPEEVRGKRGNGWSDIGYHEIIRRDGTTEKGRPINKSGAHARGFNKDSIGICLVGGMNEKGKPDCNFAMQQWESLQILVMNLTDEYVILSVVGHRDVDVDKDCPCFDVAAWWKPLQNRELTYYGDLNG